jgi:hypothetical protein
MGMVRGIRYRFLKKALEKIEITYTIDDKGWDALEWEKFDNEG